MKVAYKKGDAEPKKVKKLPMHKDPVFLANLKQELIDDHNKKIRQKLKRNK